MIGFVPMEEISDSSYYCLSLQMTDKTKNEVSWQELVCLDSVQKASTRHCVCFFYNTTTFLQTKRLIHLATLTLFPWQMF